MPVTILCPCCGKRLICSYPPEPGQSMRCHHCGKPFTVPGGANEHPPEPPARRLSPVVVGVGLLVVLLTLGGGIVALTALARPAAPPPIASVPHDTSDPPPAETPRFNFRPRPIGEPEPARVDGAAPVSVEIEPAPAAAPPDVPMPKPVVDVAIVPVMPALPEAPPRDALVKGWLPAKEQALVDNAILRGVQYLRKTQAGDGSWGRGGHAVGTTALPALALLECGVPPNDPAIRKAALYVRQHVPKLTQTYEISLAILFLDRLHAAEDEPRIVTLCLRLLAGQHEDGGWSYPCPILSRQEETSLLTALRMTRPRTTEELFVKTGDSPLLQLYLPKESGSKTLQMTLEEQNPTPSSKMVEIALSGAASKREASTEEPKGSPEPESPPAPPAAEANPELRPAAKPVAENLPADMRRAIAALPKKLQRIPALLPAEAVQKRVDDPRGGMFRGHTDNSNTQFAIIGLWAARRHQVPMDRALALIVWRFHTSQTDEGGWAYHFSTQPMGGGTSTMTGAALLGLGVGYGLTLPNGGGRDKMLPANPKLASGLKFLGDSLEPGGQRGRGRGRGQAGGDLYYWWTVERVAVLYGLRSFQGRPWYETGVADILPGQERDGSWNYRRPAIGTSFALLFLKGSNFVADLSQTIKGEAKRK